MGTLVLGSWRNQTLCWLHFCLCCCSPGAQLRSKRITWIMTISYSTLHSSLPQVVSNICSLLLCKTCEFVSHDPSQTHSDLSNSPAARVAFSSDSAASLLMFAKVLLLDVSRLPEPVKLRLVNRGRVHDGREPVFHTAEKSVEPGTQEIKNQQHFRPFTEQHMCVVKKFKKVRDWHSCAGTSS